LKRNGKKVLRWNLAARQREALTLLTSISSGSNKKNLFRSPVFSSLRATGRLKGAADSEIFDVLKSQVSIWENELAEKIRINNAESSPSYLTSSSGTSYGLLMSGLVLSNQILPVATSSTPLDNSTALVNHNISTLALSNATNYSLTQSENLGEGEEGLVLDNTLHHSTDSVYSVMAQLNKTVKKFRITGTEIEFQRVIASEDAEAIFKLSQHYQQENRFNLTKSMELLKRGEELNHAPSITNLAEILLDVTERSDVKKNQPEAVRLFEKAAQLNNTRAMNWLSLCYQKGLGTAKNLSKSVNLARKSAALGSATGMNKEPVANPTS
jgi:hypothetical protein